MERMTLARALRYKKRVIETIRQLESDIQSFNTVVAGSEREVDVRTALKQREAWVNHLIDLKMAIQKASEPIQKTVLELAETKSEIAFIQRVDTTHGLFKNRYGDVDDIKYEATIRRSEKDQWTRKLQEKIDGFQTKLDSHNATTYVELTSPNLP